MSRVLRLVPRSPSLATASLVLGGLVLFFVLSGIALAGLVARRVELATRPAEEVTEVRSAAYEAVSLEARALVTGRNADDARDAHEHVRYRIARLRRLEPAVTADEVARVDGAWQRRCAIARDLLALREGDGGESARDPGERARAAEALQVADGDFDSVLQHVLRSVIEDAREAATALEAAALGIGLAALALLVAGAILARRVLVRPLRRLVAAEAAVAGGKLDVRVDTGGLAEVRELAFGFNEMVSALRARADEVRHKQQLLSRRERALQLRNRELAAANAELDAFAYAASHDLRAPLRGIESMARFLWEDVGEQLDPESRDKLDRIRRAARRLHQLIDSLLEVARAGRELGRVEDVKLSECVHEALDALAGAIRDAKAEVVVAGEFPTVRGDRTRLTQVFQNLIGNAVKYSTGLDRAPRVEIGARIEDEGAVAAAWVRDNGIGIPEDQHVRIFQLFRRLHRAGEYEGAGVGLSIVQRAVHAHGGDVSVQSAPGKGSCFTIRLPVRSAPAALKEAA